MLARNQRKKPKRGRPPAPRAGKRSNALALRLRRAAIELEDEARYSAFHAVRTSCTLWQREAFYLRPPGYGWPVSYDVLT
jgi:hypothetical protein